MIKSYFRKQVELLLDVLPVILNADSKFALKGGTAINLFYQDIPRLSVDIALAYSLLSERSIFLEDLSDFINKSTLKFVQLGLKVDVKSTNEKIAKQMLISSKDAVIKIEPNLIIRGTVYPTKINALSKVVEQQFQKSMKIMTLSFEDLYAGKFCAALDRQHPRDLFDIKFFFESYKSISQELKEAFIVYLLSHNRPINELLNPNLLDHRESLYTKEFLGMTDRDISYDELCFARQELINKITESLSDQDKEFILSFKTGEPDWSLLNIKHVRNLPAIQWKLHNINTMQATKRSMMLNRLESILNAK